MKTENVSTPTEKTTPEETDSTKKSVSKPPPEGEALESHAKQKSSTTHAATAAPVAAPVAAPATAEAVIKPEVRGEAVPAGEARVIGNPGGVHL